MLIFLEAEAAFLLLTLQSKEDGLPMVSFPNSNE